MADSIPWFIISVLEHYCLYFTIKLLLVPDTCFVKKKWYLVKKNSLENIPRLEFEVDLKKYILIYIPLILFVEF